MPRLYVLPNIGLILAGAVTTGCATAALAALVA
jgi:uncharacterized protein involved in exopolysaccharide biosynthesis